MPWHVIGAPTKKEHVLVLSNHMLKNHLEGNTSSMHATVPLQMVCNAIVCGHRDYSNNIANLLIWGGILVRD